MPIRHLGADVEYVLGYISLDPRGKAGGEKSRLWTQLRQFQTLAPTYVGLNNLLNLFVPQLLHL